MKITLVEFAPAGGLFQFSLQLGEALAARGHEVELVTGRDPEIRPGHPGMRLVAVLPTWRPAEGVEPVVRRKVRRAWRAVLYLAAWLRVIGHLRRARPDVVQWSAWRFALDGALAAWLARRRRAPFMAVVAHTPVPLDENRRSGPLHRSGPLFTRALAAAYRRMDAVFVLGESSRAELLDAWPDVRRVEVIPHGDESVFLRGPVEPPGAAPPRVLFFGNWNRYKDFDLLLDAFSEVRSRLPGAEMVMAGDVGKDVDLGRIESRARKAGNVTLRPGYVPRDDVAGLFGTARVVAVPYRRANQSGVVHLAGTFGRPVVATDVGDIGDVVRETGGGLLVPAGDTHAFAAALERLLRRPDDADRLGAAGRDGVTSGAAWSIVAERVESVYADLASARPARGATGRWWG